MRMTLDEKKVENRIGCALIPNYKNMISYNKDCKMTEKSKTFLLGEQLGESSCLRSWVLEPKCLIASPGPLLSTPVTLGR